MWGGSVASVQSLPPLDALNSDILAIEIFLSMMSCYIKCLLTDFTENVLCHISLI